MAGSSPAMTEKDPPPSTMPRLFVVHEAQDAGELVEAEIAGLALALAEFVFGVPKGQKDIAVLGRKTGLADRASEFCVRRPLRDFQMRDRIQPVHHKPPCGTKKQSSTPVARLMNSTGV